MIPWEKIDQAKVPESNELISLQKRGDEFSIRTSGIELMNSRQHGSEEELARLAIKRINKPNARILIGGLGMGYTLAAALEVSTPETRIIVSELIPAIVEWNQTHLGHLAQNPLHDHRVTVEIEDVADIISKSTDCWDAILLDVDNGPEGLTQKENDQLYSQAGLKKAHKALKQRGILAVWSCNPDSKFTNRLTQCTFMVQTIHVRARKSQKGSKHIIWLAQKK